MNFQTDFQKKSLLLVTTSIEETWDNREKILFLSQGCLVYSKKRSWENLDYQIYKGIWIDNEQRKKDNIYLQKTYEDLLIRLVEKLNSIHEKLYTERFWRILVGFWLQLFINIYFERWKTLNCVNELYPNLKMNIIKRDHVTLSSNDCLEFINSSTTDEWNEKIYADIAKKWTRIKINVIDKPPDFNKTSNRKVEKKEILFQTIKFIYFNIIKIKDFISTNSSTNNIFIYYSYLNFRSILKLKSKVRINLLPYFSYSSPKCEENSFYRNWEIAREGDDEFLKALCEIIPRIIPRCYLEGFKKLIDFKTYWPKNPSVIMTANAFAYDDVWGAWAAQNVENGSKLILAQHGGTYGVSQFLDIQDYEISICDKYVTWGWNKTDSRKIYKGPAVKLLNLDKENFDVNGDCLLVTQSESRFSWGLSQQPLTGQMPKYFDDQFNFIDSLSCTVQKKLKVRLYFKDFGWEIKEKLYDKYPNITSVDTNVKIDKLLKDSRLCVCTYNGTTFLENFVKDIPTTMFWDPEIFLLNSESKPYFDLLIKVGILHRSPESCAKFIDSIWDDVLGWWRSEEVEESRKIFVNRYANVGDEPITQLKKIFLDW